MPIDPRIAAPVHQFSSGAYLAREAVKELSHEALIASPGAESTCMLWNFGHITNSRCGLLNILGVEHPRFHNDLFGRGAHHGDVDKYPEVAIVSASFDEVTAKLKERFATLTPAELSAPSPHEFPIRDDTVAGAVTFLALHEIYHAGQMAYLRKWLGKGQLAG